MGGYATGSLTEAERRMLFEAALDDQDLFDELAREQSRKKLIDTPGVRDRLVAKLEPSEGQTVRGGWKRPLAWGLSVSFVVGMSLTAVYVMRSTMRTAASQQVAQFNDAAQTPPSAP